MSQISVNNKLMKFVLDGSYEEDGNPTSALKQSLAVELERATYHPKDTVWSWQELQEATWDQTSVTQDMGRLSATRIIDDIKGSLDDMVRGYAMLNRDMRINTTDAYLDEEELRPLIHSMLEKYLEIGAITEYEGPYINQTLGFLGVQKRIDIYVRPTPTSELVKIIMSFF